MLAAVEGLVAELRAVGLPISVSEQVDALRALELTDLSRPGDVQVALRCALVKTAAHEHAFDTVFSLFFSSGGESDTGALEALDDQALKDLLAEALKSGDLVLQRALADIFIQRHAHFQPGRPVAGTYYLFRTLRAMDADNLGAYVSEDVVQRFRQEVEARIRRLLVADRGAEAVAKTLRTPLPEDVTFLNASAAQIAGLRATVGPLAQILAAQLAQHRRHRPSARVDLRRTIRGALSTGGVPAEIKYRPPRPPKPRLLVLADISGSVSTFAAFTLYLVMALRGAFASVRTFVFVDGVDEVTDLLAAAPDLTTATGRINSDGLGVWLDGHSDYGHALEAFSARWAGEITSRTTVLVLGDARSNYHTPRAELLGKLRDRAGQLYWLNPEPIAAWNDGDSVIGEYEPYCDAVVECRTVRQLKAFIDTVDRRVGSK